MEYDDYITFEIIDEFLWAIETEEDEENME